ncbi:hypothetical protein [Williamsia sp. CHRR-6]|uniref:hypothetical protein n=1 Tax=Williamsia sp. CHRR-6 TaxID=2835871 RepID=UPI001BDA7855|nr:hypothetical protein [Williamsia sp. CHRR-6]MBT0566205.1 hypothetical protein [Williamsia sp. CHRR-6]
MATRNQTFDTPDPDDPLDIHTRDSNNHTPLLAAAYRLDVAATRAQIVAGADVHAVEDPSDDDSYNAIDLVLSVTRNAYIPQTAQICRMLLDAGVPATERMRTAVRGIGTEFEFGRSGFNPDYVAQVDAGLAELYAMFDVTPAPAHQTHDGVSPISVVATTWTEQFNELWDLLVPPSGAALSAQGEVIRICGRINRELLGTGGANWDRQFRAMVDTAVEIVSGGTTLPAADFKDYRAAAKKVRKGRIDEEAIMRMIELSVSWVLANPTPQPFSTTRYTR